MDGILPPGIDSGPAPIHPRSAVVDGRAVVTVRGEETVLLPGESVVLDAGDPHTIRNGGER
jgi:mannose-6-phosphate isomerase-like protein (cupin superfamily)